MGTPASLPPPSYGRGCPRALTCLGGTDPNAPARQRVTAAADDRAAAARRRLCGVLLSCPRVDRRAVTAGRARVAGREAAARRPRGGALGPRRRASARPDRRRLGQQAG